MDSADAGRVPVLCFYRFRIHFSGEACGWETGTKMVIVDRSSQILGAFHQEMQHELRTWNGWRVGSKPTDYELTEYLPANGLRRF